MTCAPLALCESLVSINNVGHALTRKQGTAACVQVVKLYSQPAVQQDDQYTVAATGQQLRFVVYCSSDVHTLAPFKLSPLLRPFVALAQRTLDSIYYLDRCRQHLAPVLFTLATHDQYACSDF